MARSGWSATNYLNIGSAAVTAMPLTMSCWGNSSLLGSTAGVAMVMMALCNSANGYSANTYLLFVSTGDGIGAHCQGTAGFASGTANDISINTWFHAIAIFTSATSRKSILNGDLANAGTSVDNTGSPTVNRTSIGAFAGSAVNHAFAPAGTGLLANAALWNIALSDIDAVALSKGISPFLIRPQNLVGYWPLVGRVSPEINFKSRTTVMTVNGTLPAAAHPRIILPRHRESLRHNAYVAPPSNGKHRFFQVF